jgi:hypothetical protein
MQLICHSYACTDSESEYGKVIDGTIKNNEISNSHYTHYCWNYGNPWYQQKKAEDLAKLSGMKLGKPLSISENIINTTPYPMYKMAMDSVAGSAVPETTINPGEQELQVQLNVVFEMR